jgi:hypothetical protein
MKHYSSPREKKVLVLGLVALLSLPDSQVPPEIKPGMPQVGAPPAGASLWRPASAGFSLRAGCLELGEHDCCADLRMLCRQPS